MYLKRARWGIWDNLKGGKRKNRNVIVIIL